MILKIDTGIYMKRKARLFRSGGSYAVRIPKAWVPASVRVEMRLEGRSIIITEEGESLRELAHRFAKDGLIEFERPIQPSTPEGKSL